MAVCKWRVFDSRLINDVHYKPILYNDRLKKFRNKTMKEKLLMK